jgi:hypothetical protein
MVYNVNLCINLCKQIGVLATSFCSKISMISHSRYPLFPSFEYTAGFPCKQFILTVQNKHIIPLYPLRTYARTYTWRHRKWLPYTRFRILRNMTSLPCVRTQRHLHTQKLLTFFGGKIQTPLFPPKIPTISDVPRGVHALRDFALDGW